MAYRRRRWTAPITAGLLAYGVGVAGLVVVLTGDVSSARRWFFAVAAVGIAIAAPLIVRARRRRLRRM